MKHSLYVELLTNCAFQNIYLFECIRDHFFQCMLLNITKIILYKVQRNEYQCFVLILVLVQGI